MNPAIRVYLILASLLISWQVNAFVSPMPVDEPGILSLLGGAGAVAAILIWRNRRK